MVCVRGQRVLNHSGEPGAWVFPSQNSGTMLEPVASQYRPTPSNHDPLLQHCHVRARRRPHRVGLMRVLVVEDELDLATAIAESLRENGYATDVAGDADSALRLAAVNSYDLVCLDLNLPDGDGLDICRQVASGPIHSFDPGPPPKIIMLTARGRVADRIKGLDEGADDYLVKPFSLDELEARVRAVLRRDLPIGGATISYAGIEMDTARHDVTYHGNPVDLTVKEFALLRWFLLHPEEVQSAERLLEHVWDEHADPFTNTVRMTISNLRRKLAEADAPQVIVTLPGRGYALREST